MPILFKKMGSKIITLIIALQISGCSLVTHFLYQIDVQQGNVVTQEMLDMLKPGMTKSQVRFVLGSPLIVDAFRDNRWDYAFVDFEHGDLIEKKRLTIFFENDLMVKMDQVVIYSERKESETEPKKKKKTQTVRDLEIIDPEQ